MAFGPAIKVTPGHIGQIVGGLLSHSIVVFNGPFAVMIFFVLSGFVLAQSSSKADWSLPARLAARYLRLTIPMTLSLVFAWILLWSFPTSRLEIQQIAPNLWLSLVNVGASLPAFHHALEEGFYRVYLNGFSPLNNVVWTMQFELIGSVGIYVFYRYCPPQHRLIGAQILLVLSPLAPFFMGFPAGAMLRELWVRGNLPESKWCWRALIVAVVLFVIGYVPGLRIAQDLFNACSAGLLVMSVLALAPLQKWLSMGPPRFLGRISFALYLVHVPLIVTLGAWSYLHFPGSPFLKLAIALGEVLVGAILLAWLGTIFVDEPLLRHLHHFRRFGRVSGLSPALGAARVEHVVDGANAQREHLPAGD